MKQILRPIDGWPHTKEQNPQRSRFDTTWRQTLQLLETRTIYDRRSLVDHVVTVFADTECDDLGALIDYPKEGVVDENFDGWATPAEAFAAVEAWLADRDCIAASTGWRHCYCSDCELEVMADARGWDA